MAVRALLSRILSSLRARKTARSRRAARLVGLACLAAMLALRVWDPAPIQTLRLKAMDLYQLMAPRQATSGAVTIIDIDEESLAELGQWPWPRTVIADLVEATARAGAAVVGFDAVFPEPDRMSPGEIAGSARGLDDRTARVLAQLPSNDEIFSDIMRRTRVVLGQAGYERATGGRTVAPAKRTPVAEVGDDPRPWLVKLPGLVRNISTLEAAASGLGIMTLEPERDGVVRRIPGIINIGGNLYPALAVEVLRVATGQNAIAIKADGAGIKSIVVARVEVPTDHRGRIWLHYAPHDPEWFVSAKDVISGKVPPQRLKGKLVLVGTSAAGLQDIKATPLGYAMSGVEIQAQLLDTILSRSHLVRPNNAVGAELVASAVLGILMIVIVPLLGAIRSLLVGALMVGGVTGVSWYLFAQESMLFDATFPLLAGLLVYASTTYMNYIKEEGEKRQVRNAFGRYLSPDVVERLAADPSQLKLGGEMKELSLMFCDIRGFTAISESLDAERLTSLINRFLTPMTDVILRAGGTIDKYMGDCIMAFWNAPLDQPEHARQCCLAALDMVRELERLDSAWRSEAEAASRPHIPIRMGIGINTGVGCVGNMGSEQRFDYSVLGDTVNLASRLEGQSKTYMFDIIIGEGTQAQIPDLATLELDVINVRGKSQSVRIFALYGDEAVAASEEFRTLQARNQEMLLAYRLERWSELPPLIADCRRIAYGRLDGFCDYYESRIEAHVA